MLRFKSWLIICIMLTLAVSLVPVPSATQAQGDDAPIALWIDGDYWRYTPATGNLAQITTWGRNGQPQISPDGQQIAYASVSSIAVDLLESGAGLGDALLPFNIWVLDVATGDGFRPADQPPGATFTPSASNYITRSMPVWSPGGDRLAWTELVVPGQTLRLAIYTFATDTTTITNLPITEQIGLPSTLPLRWGNNGIAVQSVGFNANNQTPQFTYHLYDSAGNPLGVIGPLDVPPNNSLINFEWIINGSQEFLGVLFENGQWMLVSPSAPNQPQSYQGPIELYSPAQPNQHRVRVTLLGQSTLLQGTMVLPNGTTAPLPNGQTLLDFFSLSPTADGAVYTRLGQGQSAAYVWRNGAEQPINVGNRVVTGAVWGYGRWRVPEGAVIGPPPAQPIDDITPPTVCAGFLPSRLTPDSQAHVLPGAANNLRDQPDTQSNQVGQIPAGATFSVIDGPVCANGLAWWQVSYNGLTGWTAEGSGDEYWLKPGPANSLAPNLPGAVLAVTESGSPVVAYEDVSRSTDEVETLLWGDRVLWSGRRINNQTLTWLEVTLGSGRTAYIVDESGALTVQDPGHQTSNLAVGQTVVVTGDGAGMHLRASASTYVTERETLAQGEALTITGGPVYSEYFIWWQFRTAEGITGWAVDVPGWLVAQ